MKQTLKEKTLFFTEGGSDKEYRAWLIQTESGFSVEFAFGRRGSALKHGLKTDTPLAELAKAEKVFDALVLSKTKKGYTEQESGETFTSAEFAGRKTAFNPHLLTALSEQEGLALLGKEDLALQVKFDGERRYLSMKDGVCVAANRQGLEVPMPVSVSEALLGLEEFGITQVELDGEDMGGHVMVFDVLSLNGADYRAKPFADRLHLLERLDSMLNPLGGSAVRVANTLKTSEIGPEFVLALKANREEGYVLKSLCAPYVDGGRNADQFKIKFWKDATVRVRSVSQTKRSVSIEVVCEDQTWQEVGNVTIPANVQDIPTQGSLISVRYLYAYEGGSLYQPIFQRERLDQTEQDAHIGQLEYKKAA